MKNQEAEFHISPSPGARRPGYLGEKHADSSLIQKCLTRIPNTNHRLLITETKSHISKTTGARRPGYPDGETWEKRNLKFCAFLCFLWL